MSQTTALSSGPAVWTATICNLTPDTAYRYRITLTEPTPDGHRDRPDEDDGWRQFRTARTEGGTVRAGWLADTGLAGRPDGNATGTERIYKELIHADCTVVLGGGDYAYANADGRYDSVEDAIDEWFRQAEDLIGSVPFMPQYGNHEIYLEERFEDWAPRFVLPLGSRDGRCYAFTVGCVRFVSFFAPGRNPADAHIAWLQEDLESPERQRCRWCVVYHHEAMYGHGYSHPTNLNIRNLLAPVYEAAAVDLVVNAHDQNYERTYPLVQIPHIAALGSVDLSSYRQGEGVIFLKSSPGGKRSEIGNRFSPFTAPQDRAIAVRDATGHHYSILEATPEMLTVRSFLVPEDAATRELETFSIHAVEA